MFLSKIDKSKNKENVNKNNWNETDVQRGLRLYNSVDKKLKIIITISNLFSTLDGISDDTSHKSLCWILRSGIIDWTKPNSCWVRTRDWSEKNNNGVFWISLCSYAQTFWIFCCSHVLNLQNKLHICRKKLLCKNSQELFWTIAKLLMRILPDHAKLKFLPMSG